MPILLKFKKLNAQSIVLHILLSFARDFANITVTTYFVAYLRSVISCSIFHGIV